MMERSFGSSTKKLRIDYLGIDLFHLKTPAFHTPAQE